MREKADEILASTLPSLKEYSKQTVFNSRLVMTTKAVFSLNILDLAMPLGRPCSAALMRQSWYHRSPCLATVTLILSTMIAATNPTSGDAISESGSQDSGRVQLLKLGIPSRIFPYYRNGCLSLNENYTERTFGTP
jgi:hypothetical protein